jgi:putative aldouronate transport system permease protein
MNKTFSKKITNVFLHIFFAIFSLAFIIPTLTVISISLSDEVFVKRNGYSIIPKILSVDAYNLLFSNPGSIIDAYKISTTTTILGTLFGLLFCSMCAYALSRVDFKFRRQITFYLFFTMLFSGGLVPSYILVTRYLHLKDNILSLILPGLVNVFFIFMLRTFFQSLPFSIIESCVMDGAGEFRIFAQIIIPLSKPALATVGLMIMLNYWNEWFSALLYINKNQLRPLQYLLQQMLLQVEALTREISEGSGATMLDPTKVPTETTRMAMAVIATGPMLLVFPFFQKYFVKGLTVGSVKG